jgi:hypothetical protein
MRNKIYYCYVKNQQIFNGSRVTVDDVTGKHEKPKKSDDVNGFIVLNAPNMNKFPSGLESFLENLTLISVENSKLSEITSEDLTPFPQMRVLILRNNKISAIKANLFINNRHLEAISFYGNEIKHIDSNVFDVLKFTLTLLDFSATPCTSLGYAATRDDVVTTIRRINDEGCYSDEHATTTTTTTTRNPLLDLIDRQNLEMENLKNRVSWLQNEIKNCTTRNRDLEMNVTTLKPTV